MDFMHWLQIAGFTMWAFWHVWYFRRMRVSRRMVERLDNEREWLDRQLNAKIARDLQATLEQADEKRRLIAYTEQVRGFIEEGEARPPNFPLAYTVRPKRSIEMPS